MKMSYNLETRVYVRPGEGQTVHEFFKEIYSFVNDPAHVDFKVFVIKPDGEMFEVVGKSEKEVFGSIFVNCAESQFHYDESKPKSD